MEVINNVKALLDAGVASTKPDLIVNDGVPFKAVPDGYILLDLEKFLPEPTRKRGKVVTTDTDGFIFYTVKHGDADTTSIYADIDAQASRFGLIAVLNDHGTKLGAPHWRDHRCLFEPTQAIEWKRWSKQDRTSMSQAAFAAWLEDNLADVAAVEGMPTGADILQMSLGFEATADKRLRSKLNLQSGGTQFEYVDDEDKDTRTRMQVFERFTLGLPVFEGSTNAYQIEARLKYREKDGRMTFWYELIRPDRVFKTAVADELARIKEATAFNVIAGRPES